MVLARGMEDLHHLLVGQQFEERLKVDIRGQRVHHHGLVRARHLRDAEQRVIGGFAQELGIDGDEGMPRHVGADPGEFRGGGDRLHRGGEPNPIRLVHGNRIISFSRAPAACG
jgi:hypothetical protein